MRKQLWLVSLLLILSACPLLAADDHNHPYDRGEKLGTVSFTISCATVVRQPFERGVALMHSFSYDEAEKQFKALEKEDPGCAMTYWGEAMSLLRGVQARPRPAACRSFSLDGGHAGASGHC